MPDRAAPPGPDIDDVMARDALWFAYSTGSPDPAGLSVVSAELLSETDVAPILPAAAAGGAVSPLPRGTAELLADVPFPAGRVAAPPDADAALGYALVAAFGVQRREPENPFNDHRCYPSVRSKFPVHHFVADGERRRVLDLYRHALVELADVAGAGRRPVARQVLLAARYTRLPPLYKWFRDSLINLELGINLRALCIGLELLGWSGRLRLPDEDAVGRLAELGLVPSWEWSLPLTVELTTGPGTPVSADSADSAPARPERSGPTAEPDVTPDPVLAHVVTMNRTQTSAGPPTPLGPAIPAATTGRTTGPSWADLLWRRTSGSMPQGLYGMSGRRRQLPAEAFTDAVGWLSVPPPAGLLADVAAAITCSVVVQAVDGYADGVYRVAGGRAHSHIRDTGIAARFEEHYLYPLAPGNGCDVRHASFLWFFSMAPRQVVGRFGTAAWSAAQYACGWAAHGLCLSAAAHGLYARPVRAFSEIPTRGLLDLGPEEMIVFAVISGTPRYRGHPFDLRV